MSESECVTYRLEVPTDEWEQWKQTVSHDKTLNEALRGLIAGPTVTLRDDHYERLQEHKPDGMDMGAFLVQQVVDDTPDADEIAEQVAQRLAEQPPHQPGHDRVRADGAHPPGGASDSPTESEAWDDGLPDQAVDLIDEMVDELQGRDPQGPNWFENGFLMAYSTDFEEIEPHLADHPNIRRHDPADGPTTYEYVA